MGILDAPALSLSDAKKNYASRRRAGTFSKGAANVVTRLMGVNCPDGTAAQWSPGTQTQGLTRLKVVATADASDLRLVYGNYSYGAAGLNNITIKAAVETDVPNVTYTASLRGSRSVTIEPDGVAEFEPIPITVKKGDVLWIRTWVSVGTAGDKWPHSAAFWQTGEAVTDDADLTSGTGTTGFGTPLLAAYYEYGIAPIAVLGTPVSAVPYLGLSADSIVVGLGDTAATTNRGWAVRAINGSVPYVNVSRHTEAVGQMRPLPAAGTGPYTPIAWRHKMRLLSGCTHILTAYGTNDIGALDATQQNLIGHWSDLAARGMKVSQATLIPRTTSTDKWITTANQATVASEAVRVQLNDWLRDGAPLTSAASLTAVATGTAGALRAGQSGHPLSSYIEISDSVESARNSGKFKAPARTVANISTTASSIAVDAGAASFTASDLGRALVITGAGTSGGLHQCSITNVYSATRVYVTPSPVTTAAGQTMYFPFTGDGIHPTADAHEKIAADNTAAVAAFVAS